MVQTLLDLGGDIDVAGECPELRSSIELRLYQKHHGSLRECAGSVTPLQIAAAMGQDEICSMLVNRGANVNLGAERGTALQLASYFGQCSTVQLLMRLGADVKLDGGWRGSALQRASSCGDLDTTRRIGGRRDGQNQNYIEVVRLLLDRKADVDAPPREKGTALQRASGSGMGSIVKLLWRCGADINTPAGTFGTALQRAADHGHLEIVRFLISKGVDINAAGGPFGTALQRAAERGHAEIAKELLKAGALVNSGANGTPLQKACAGGHFSTTKLLLDHGADAHAEGGYFWKIDFWSNDFWSSTTSEGDPEALSCCGRQVEYNLCHLRSIVNSVHKYSRRYDIFSDVYDDQVLPLLRLLVDSRASFTGHTAVKDWQKTVEMALDVNDVRFFRALVERAPDMEDIRLLKIVDSLCKDGRTDLLELILPKIADVPSFQRSECPVRKGYSEIIYGEDLLTMAAVRGHLDVLTTLLDHGFDVDSHAPESNSPLEAAATNGALQSVRILLERGADIGNDNGSRAVSGASSFGKLEIMQLLLRLGAVYAAIPPKSTPLVAAAKRGQEKSIKLLLEHYNSLITTTDRQEAFDIALSKGFFSCAYHLLPTSTRQEYTLEQYVREQNDREDRERDLIRTAVGNSVDELVDLLENGVNIDANPNDVGTPLQKAAGRGLLNVVEKLLEYGANPDCNAGIWDNDTLTGAGTALQRAAAGGHTEICKLLISHNANLELDANTKSSAIERAAELGHVEIVELLLRNGAKVDSWSNHAHGTALQRATFGGFLSIVTLLLEHGANVNSQAGSRGSSLEIAVSGNYLEIIQLLLAKGANIKPEPTKKIFHSLLYTAARHKNMEMIKILIKHGAEVNYTQCGDEDYWRSMWWDRMTALHRAVEEGSLEMTQILIDSGADVSIRYEGRNGVGKTAFQLAITRGCEDIIKYMASLNQIDLNEPWKRSKRSVIAKTSLRHAIELGQENIANILRNKGAIEWLPGVIDPFPY